MYLTCRASEEVLELMRKSLKKDRWAPLELGDDKNYTAKAVQDRWTQQRNAWLVSTNLLASLQKQKSTGADPRDKFPAGQIPQELTDPERRRVKRTMKALQGPYEGFNYHYPLEEAIDIYMEIWYDSSSSDS